jgi:two-component system response regulator FixJ
MNLNSETGPISPTVFIVDDDNAIRFSLRMLLEADGFEVEDFSSAEVFLDRFTTQCYGCLITDLRMPKIDGLRLQSELTERGIKIPVIMLTGHADVPTAVESLKAGAIDFIEKPFDPPVLLQLIHKVLIIETTRQKQLIASNEKLEHLARLTRREREVATRVSAGQSNKFIAIELGISDRTVELHRSRAMKKLKLRSVPELVRLLSELPADETS